MDCCRSDRRLKEVMEDIEVIEPCLTCGHTGILFWCSVHKRYECEKCCMEDEKEGIFNADEA